ncbi:MAG: hypothetical protein J6U21_15045 [Bacteroidales bacterium]|nr:hypothetical protein [Bacteroidales bacterium]
MNSNNYRKGYEDGYRDAINGKDASIFKAGLQKEYWIGNSKVAWDTYVEGYKEGYRIGSRDRMRNQ